MATDDTRAQQIKTIFLACVDLDEQQRRAFLDEHCPDDLREEVEELLRSSDDTGEEFERPALETLDPAAEDETDIPPLQMIDEFQIIRKIGEGGMGVVYLARDSSLERLVALKVLPAAHMDSQARLQRFRHEAITVAQLKHPGIVQVHRVSQSKEIFYLAMDYVEGTNLQEELEQRREERENGFERVNRRAEYVRAQASLIADVADALDYVHRNDVIHRDIKPSNILINAEGKPLLSDFGVARNLRHPSLSTPGALAGTFAYMSPEQARAKAAKVDHRSDVFSLGVVLYESLSLERPFGGKTQHQLLRELTTKDPPPLRSLNPSVDRDLETIIRKALEKEPVHRYQSAAHMAADLRAWLRGDPILARRPTLTRRVRTIARRHKVATAVAASLMLGVFAGGIGVALMTVDRAQAALFVEVPEGLTTPPPSTVTATFIPLVWRNAGGAPAERRGEDPRSANLPVNVRHTQSLDPGAYWVHVESEDGWFAESPIVVKRGGLDELVLRLTPPSDDPPEGMVLIPAESDLPPFWIDRAEVSNAQYRAFLQSLPTNEAAALRPLWWPDPWEDRLDDLPVTGVSWRAARRYAAWAGKRLPTREEWDRAVGGDDDRAYPWGNDAGPPPCYANVGPGDGAAFLDVSADAPAESLARAINAYIANVQPVDAPTPRAGDDCPTSPEGLGRDRTPLGVMHLYANVEEWTASTPAPTDAFGDARYAYRVVKGFSWERRPGPGHPVRGLAEGQARVDSQILGTGFRCARSALVGGRAASIFTIEPDASARAAPAPGDRTHPL